MLSSIILGAFFALAIPPSPALCYGAAVAASTDPASYDKHDIIKRDVLVIGAGSTGIYTSIRLKDHQKTVLVVEKKSTIGGHAEDYIDPSGVALDMGVATFAHTDTVRAYFDRFNLSLIPFQEPGVRKYVDFSTGKLTNFPEPDVKKLQNALATYVGEQSKYPTVQGSFNMTYPVAPDLLLPFGDFVAKYGLEDLVPRVFALIQGAVPLLEISTLYVFKYLSAQAVNSQINGFLTTEHHHTMELYQRAAEFLGWDNILLNSTVSAMDRSCPDEVRVALCTPAGPKLVIAKKLLSTPPPLLENLSGYDLSADETHLFGQFFGNGYYAALLRNTGINYLNTSILNIQPGQRYDVPKLPGIYAAIPLPIGHGLLHVYYGSPKPLPDEQVKADIIANIQRYQKANGLPVTKPEVAKYVNHAVFNVMVSKDAIKDGFYKKLYTLQGQRNTFYNGIAWHTQDSSLLWKFTDDYIIPIFLASFKS